MVILFCVIYGSAGIGLSLINKKIYATFGEVDPMNLLFVQTATNLSLCLIMMTIKTMGISNFTSLQAYGIDIPNFETIAKKLSVGIRVGLANLATVIFSTYAYKYATIPVFLAHRRAGILSTVIVAYLTAGEKPTKQVMISTTLATLGAAISGYSSLALTKSVLDLVLVWACRPWWQISL